MLRQTFRWCTVGLLFLAPMLAIAQTSAQGHWQGAIEIPGRPLEVQVDLAETSSQWSGTISIPVQSMRDQALQEVAVNGDAVSFSIPGVPGDPTFKGELASDGAHIAGTFTQGPQSIPFSLERAQPAEAVAAEALAGFDEFIAANLEPWDTPAAAIAIVRGGELVYAKGFGYRDVSAKLPATADTLFAIGSCTKAFTTFTLGTLVDEGKLDWNTPVRNYIPGFRMYDDAATMGLTPVDMVTHRSGLPRHDLLWYNDEDLSRKELVERLRYLRPSAKLREKYQYNNLMYVTAGYLVRTLTGGSWEDAVRTRILDPLQMSRSNFSVLDSQKDADFSKPYRMNDDDEVIEIPFRNITGVGPAGSINSSVTEMSRWLIANLRQGKYGDRQLIQAATLREIHTPQMAIPTLPMDKYETPSSYAMGWVVSNPRGRLMLQHGGGIDGFSALVTLFPLEDAGIVVLTNASGSGFPGVLTLHAADRLFGEPRRDWNAEALARYQQGRARQKEAASRKGDYRKTGTKPSHPLADYAGEYEHPGYGVVSVEQDGRALRAIYNRIATPLEHWHYDVFAGAESADPTFENMHYQFRMDAEGNIALLRAPFERSVDPIVFRKRPPAEMYDPAHLDKFAGAYVLGALTAQVARNGNTLSLHMPRQPTYELVPRLDGWFDLEGLQGFRARFETNDAGKMTLILNQPNGVFTAVRI